MQSLPASPRNVGQRKLGEGCPSQTELAKPPLLQGQGSASSCLEGRSFQRPQVLRAPKSLEPTSAWKKKIGPKVYPSENRWELEVLLPPEIPFFILYLVLSSPFWNSRCVLSRFFITLSRKGAPKPGLTPCHSWIRRSEQKIGGTLMRKQREKGKLTCRKPVDRVSMSRTKHYKSSF